MPQRCLENSLGYPEEEGTPSVRSGALERVKGRKSGSELHFRKFPWMPHGGEREEGQARKQRDR